MLCFSLDLTWKVRLFKLFKLANVGTQGGLGTPQGGRTDHHSLQGVEHWLPSDGVGMTRKGQVTTPGGDVDAGSAGPWNDCAGTGALISRELGSGCIFCIHINIDKLSCSTVCAPVTVGGVIQSRERSHTGGFADRPHHEEFSHHQTVWTRGEISFSD